MSGFQILATVVIGGLVLRDWRNWSRSPAGLFVRLLRMAVWLVTLVAILSPIGIVQPVADLLGIKRAADLVLYLFVLAFLWSSFYFYSRCLRLEREITALTRHIAIQEADRQPSAAGDFPADGPGPG